MASAEGSGSAHWRFTTVWATAIVAGIIGNNEEAKTDFYVKIGPGIKSYLRRQLPPYQIDDRAHNVVIATLQAIQAGKLREPERLLGYVRTIAQRQVVEAISEMQQDRASGVPLDALPITDHRPDPEKELASARRIEVMVKVLGQLSPVDKDILVRWYMREQTTATICAETGLTEKQVSNRKYRAVLKLRAAVRNQMSPFRRLPERMRAAC
jgi:RNA polymerase sigma-70 factor, ECF subfamily